MVTKRKTPAPRRPHRGSLMKLHAAVEAEGEGAVFRLIAEGKTMRQVGAAFGISADSIYKWIHEGGENRRQAWADAKRRSADSLVDEGLQILDDGADITNSAQATIARSRAEYRKWLASIRNREDYGDQAGVQVNLSIGELHLRALQAKGRSPLPEKEPIVLGGEVT